MTTGLWLTAILVLSIAPINRSTLFTHMVERLLNYFKEYPLDFLSHLSSSLPIIVGFIRYKKLNRSERLIWLLFILYFFKDTYVLVYIFTASKPSTFFIDNIEQVIITLFVGLIYFFSFENSSQKRLIIVFTILCSIITILAYNSLAASTVSLSASRIFSITLALLYFNKIIKDMQVKVITKHSLFWFTAALLLYTAGTFFIMLFSEYWFKETVSDERFDFYWNINQILFIIFCILSSYGLWMSKYKLENFI